MARQYPNACAPVAKMLWSGRIFCAAPTVLQLLHEKVSHVNVHQSPESAVHRSTHHERHDNWRAHCTAQRDWRQMWNERVNGRMANIYLCALQREKIGRNRCILKSEISRCILVLSKDVLIHLIPLMPRKRASGREKRLDILLYR